MPASSSMPWSRRFTIAGRPIGAASSIIATAGRNTYPSSTPSASPSRDRAVDRQCRRQLRQRFGRDDQRALQGRSDPQAWTGAQLRSRRICHARMGRLVQPSSAAGAYRQHPACRSRRAILCCRKHPRYCSVTHNPRPPADPARFMATRRKCFSLEKKRCNEYRY